LNNVVASAFELVAEELNKTPENQLKVKISTKDGLCLTVEHGEEQAFVYRVLARKCLQPGFVAESEDDTEEQAYYRAEVHLLEGGQDYDIMGWSKAAVINNIIAQYHKHLHFLHLLR
jgi:choline/glycine/proline betaine transport protein